jgi:hypothetical protein
MLLLTYKQYSIQKNICTLTAYRRAKLRVSSSHFSPIITIPLKAKQRSYAAAILFFYILLVPKTPPQELHVIRRSVTVRQFRTRD